jgi:hypothetical protein
VLLAIGLLLSPAHAVALECPADFRAFLRKFEADRSFQLAHIRFPLAYVEPDRTSNLYPDAPAITRRLSKSSVVSADMPIYPSRDDQTSIPLKRQIKSKGSSVIVRFDKPESDAHIYILHFSRSKSCWHLTKVQDASL